MTTSLYKLCCKEIENENHTIQDYDRQINELMVNCNTDTKDENHFNNELDEQTTYIMELDDKFSQFELLMDEENHNSNNSASSRDLSEIFKLISTSEAKPPPLECGSFNGKEKDKFAFNTFLNQFIVVIGIELISLNPQS